MAEKPGVLYSEIRPHLRSLDLLLFRGTDVVSGIISRVERYFDGTTLENDFTHVGLCIRPEKGDLFGGLKLGGLYVMESTMSGNLADGVKDVHGESHLGVQVRDLDAVVEAYDSKPKARLAWAPLKEELRPVFPDKICDEALRKYTGIFYDASVVDLAAAAGVCGARAARDCRCFECLRDMACWCVCTRKRAGSDSALLPKDNKPSNYLFCSELVANIYRDCRVLPQTVEPKNVMPEDFLPNPKNPQTTVDADKQVPLVISGIRRFKWK